MRSFTSLKNNWLRDRSGNIGIIASAATPLIVCLLALAVDYGHLTLQRRELQKTTDLAAIVAASNIQAVEQATSDHFARNSLNYAVRTKTGLLTAAGEVPFDENDALANYQGYASVTKGHYSADISVPVKERFKPDALPPDAVKVVMRKRGKIYFPTSFFGPLLIQTEGTAASKKLAAFSVGSRLLSLNGGILNRVLGGLLGSTISLKVMDYEALLDADVNALHLIDALAVDLGLTAGTYSDVLKTEITYGQLLDALTATTGIKPNAASVLRTLEGTIGKTQVKLKMEEILNLDPYASSLIGSGDKLRVDASVFDLITAAAVAANGGNQIAVDLGTTVPGLAALKLSLAIGEPPVGTPSLAVGTPGSIVRTAQTRIKVSIIIDGLNAIAGLKVQVPLYVEVANAEARLSNIKCYGGAPDNAGVDVEAAPGVAEIALGTIDDTAFLNFGTRPRITSASIIDSPLLKIEGIAHTYAGNLSPKTLSFTPANIAAGIIKTVSTQNTLTSLVQSLLRNLDLDIQVLFLTLGTPTAVQAALADTLSLITEPLDSVLYNTLLILGIRIGEADVRVTDVSCQRPVLVQ